MYSNITVDRLEQIHRERELTYADQTYQRWMHDLKVGSMCIDKGPIHNAKLAMQEWDISRLNIERITINTGCM